MTILNTVTGTIKTWRGLEEKTHAIMGPRKLTLRGIHRIIKKENPQSTFSAERIEHHVVG